MRFKFSFTFYLVLILFFYNLHEVIDVLSIPVEYYDFILRFLKIVIILGYAFVIKGLRNKLLILVLYPILKIVYFLLNTLTFNQLNLHITLGHIGLVTILSLYMLTSNLIFSIIYIVIVTLFYVFFGTSTFILTSAALVLVLNQINRTNENQNNLNRSNNS
jgi:hypothetical protein